MSIGYGWVHTHLEDFWLLDELIIRFLHFLRHNSRAFSYPSISVKNRPFCQELLFFKRLFRLKILVISWCFVLLKHLVFLWHYFLWINLFLSDFSYAKLFRFYHLGGTDLGEKLLCGDAVQVGHDLLLVLDLDDLSLPVGFFLRPTSWNGYRHFVLIYFILLY